MIKILSIKLLILSTKERYIENIIVNLWIKNLKILNNNKIKYNLYYRFRVKFDNIIEFNIVEIDINIKINIIESFRLLLIFINLIQILSIL